MHAVAVAGGSARVWPLAAVPALAFDVRKVLLACKSCVSCVSAVGNAFNPWDPRFGFFHR